MTSVLLPLSLDKVSLPVPAHLAWCLRRGHLSRRRLFLLAECPRQMGRHSHHVHLDTLSPYRLTHLPARPLNLWRSSRRGHSISPGLARVVLNQSAQ